MIHLQGQTNNRFSLRQITLVTLLLILSNCAYKNIPEKTNITDKNGLKQGIWIESNIENDEERISLKYYKNNVLNGHYREFFPDGILAGKGEYKNGIQIGRWEYFLQNGTMISWQVFDKKGQELEIGRINPVW
ncbi:MAG: hypothetical protein WCR52_19670 [Bacteroidota bacterium]